uniref:CxC3 like cysteine cluster domain-containing protein n=1 Tax=Daphnia galeata TaxID=27404 RepID=A0A8J2WET6_9CRUS|nr:unnamed protein product [Daphnia galeata]
MVATRFGTFFGTSYFGVFGTNFSVSAPRWSVSAPPSDITLSIEDLLSFWHQLSHKTPGISERKFVETLEEISLANDRVNIINRTLFNRSRREFEFYQYHLEKTIFRRHGKCKICGPHPHGMHADAIRKLYRFAEASHRLGESLYGDVRMAYDDTKLEHISKIEKKIPKAKGNDLCGSSTWKAAKGETSILYNGHWEKGGADMLGEEQEQCRSSYQATRLLGQPGYRAI